MLISRLSKRWNVQDSTDNYLNNEGKVVVRWECLQGVEEQCAR